MTRSGVLLLCLLAAGAYAQQQQQQQEAQAPPPVPQNQQQQQVPQQQQQQPPQQQVEPAASVNNEHISQFDACKDDIHKYCSHEGVDLKSDISILECLQDAGQSESETLTEPCENLVWQFKVKLTQDTRFANVSAQYCADEFRQLPGLAACSQLTGAGYALSCMVDYIHNVSKTSKCYAFLTRVERLAFSDFRLIGPFVEKCGPIVTQFGCGTLTPPSAHQKARLAHSQGFVVECLIERVAKQAKNDADSLKILGDGCRFELQRIAELQSDDFHLDRPLFFACREDREKFCPSVPSGGGKVFECLMAHRVDPQMHQECQKVLGERAILMGQNYRLAHPLTKACDTELKAYKCEPQGALEAAVHFHMNWILMCLETGAKQPGVKLPTNECAREMLNHRQMMMSEFRMAPEVVMQCAKEIDQFCSPRGDLEAEGRTLHCLMEHAQARDETKKIGSQCLQALGQVVKAADIVSNYKVDKVLYASCKALIDGACAQDALSEVHTLNCLTRHIDAPDMNAQCEQRLLEVQYFVARDWTLDPQLYDACHQDAVAKCGALDNWHQLHNDRNLVDPGPQVLACLYRSAYDEQNQLTDKCVHEIRRVLHERAARVNLLPNVEAACREALSEYCSRNVKPLEEMNCLQQYFETPKFKAKFGQCYAELANFTAMESKDTKLNRLLTIACKPVISTYCEQFANEEIDHGDVMECLYEHRDTPEMSGKCRSYVNHFELISMRDYHFSAHFLTGCRADIQQHCANAGQDKASVIRCLSEVVFEHKVLDAEKDLAKECKKQLRRAFLQQEQASFADKEHMIDADPQLMGKCAREVRQFKCDAAEKFEDVVECLRERFDQLGPDCKALVFEREKIEAVDNTLDDELQTKCKQEIADLCPNRNDGNVLSCLTNSKIVRRLRPECLKIVTERMAEHAKDARLRPGLLAACRAESERYCSEDLAKMKNPAYAEQPLEGVLIACLRKQFRASINERVQLSVGCRDEISAVILEAELNVELDRPLFQACHEVIPRQCGTTVIAQSGNFDSVLECLKSEYNKGAIADRECTREVTRRLQESLIDIHLDPALYEACADDAQRLCRDVTPGQSRIITCLVTAADAAGTQMSAICRAKLSERNQLWMKAHQEHQLALPSSWADLWTALQTHPQRVSLFGYFLGIVAILFLIGCCCGRATKRVHRELKNR